ncbi:helix-turn-helix domain-containing protein [Nocardia amikacinitolerans]|uniref:helix-turn-helix domain-containing protein n=1 Tax=Nocardia amikacinitolerans TaxID=756689 RepID=UPI0036D1823B
MSARSVFWDDLADDLKDPEFLREFVLSSIRIKTVDSIINSLDQARVDSDLSKAALARAASLEPSAVRRLFSAESSNPTLHTVSELAAALGMRLTLAPLEGPESAVLTAALKSGKAGDLVSLASAVEQFDCAGVS